MLASTVQFSNNDQPPVTTRSTRIFTGAGIEGRPSRPYLQIPNSVPDTISRPDQRSTLRRAVLAPGPS
jgi:hypothetical protein